MKKIYFLKYSYGVICFCICFFCVSSELFAQNTPVAGDFKSVTTGNWHDHTTWQIFDGAAWQTTTFGQIPNQNSAVFLESNTAVLLQQDAEVKNLFVNDVEDVNRLNTQGYDLSIFGKLGLYSGSVTDPGGIGAPDNGVISDPSNPVLVMKSDVGGSLKFVGTSDRTIIYDTEFHANLRLAGWNLEFAFTNSAVGLINETIRFGNLIASSGHLNLSDADRMLVDESGIAGEVNGSVLIKNGAVVQGSRGFWHSGTHAMKNLTIEQGGKLFMRYTTPVIAAESLNLAGTFGLIGNINQNFPTTGGRIGAVPLSIFGNLVMDLSGSKRFQNNVVVSDTLFLKGTASISPNGYMLSYGVAGSLNFSGSTAQSTSDVTFPSSGGPFSLIINNPNHVTLHASRMIEGNLTLGSGRLILGNNNFTIGENSLAIGGTFSADNMVLINGTGMLQREFFQPSAFEFPVGNINSGISTYAPITLNFTEGAFGDVAIVGVAVANTKHPNDDSAEDFLNRYWTVSGSHVSGYKYSVIANYLDVDINGQEEDISAFIYTGLGPQLISNLNVEQNKIIANDIAAFGDITGSNLCDITNNSFVSTPVTTSFCQTSANMTIDGSTALSSGIISYQWEERFNEGTWQSITEGISEDLTIATKTVAGTYDVRRIVETDICDFPSLSETFTFTILPEISLNAIDNTGASTICVGEVPEEFIGTTPAGGDNTYEYDWQSRKDGGTWSSIGVSVKNYHEIALSEAGLYEYKRLVTSRPCTIPSESNIISITVEPTVSNNSISTPETKFCGSSPDFSISGTTPGGGNGTFTYSWERRHNEAVWTVVGSDKDFAENSLSALGIYEYRRLVSSGNCLEPQISDTLTVILGEAPSLSGVITDATSANSDGSIAVEVSGGLAPYSFNWSNGAITKDLDNIPGGIYTLTVTDDNGCSVAEDFNVGQITGLKDEENNNYFVVYPNPLQNEKLTVEINLVKFSEVYLTVYNNIGGMVAEQKFSGNDNFKSIVDLDRFPSGLYHVDIFLEGKHYSRKVIKN